MKIHRRTLGYSILAAPFLIGAAAFGWHIAGWWGPLMLVAVIVWASVGAWLTV
jgi:hypothetical protein